MVLQCNSKVNTAAAVMAALLEDLTRFFRHKDESLVINTCRGERKEGLPCLGKPPFLFGRFLLYKQNNRLSGRL